MQVDIEHYNFSDYVNINRWSSYWYQISLIEKNVKDILLIGVGDAIVPSILTNLGYNVHTFDYDKELNPTYVGSILELNNIVKRKYDLIICCQVLEHLPLENFENIISQFSKISNNVILSLPYNRLSFFIFKGWLPKIHNFGFEIRMPKFYQRNYRFEVEGWNQHYWEVGIKKCKKKLIRKQIEKYYEIDREFIPLENRYHIFYVLRKGE